MASYSLSDEWRRRCNPQRPPTECPPLIITPSIEEGGWFGGLRFGAGIELLTIRDGRSTIESVSASVRLSEQGEETNSDANSHG